jgi:hypothetical protein
MKEAVVNELSFLKSPNFELPAADDLEAARPLMKNFVVCASEGFRLGIISTLRMSESFHAVELAAGYPIAIWMTDKSVDRDDRVRFIRFATSSPYIDGDLEETTFGDCIARGLGSCMINRSVAVSCASDAAWSMPLISVMVRRLSEDGTMTEIDETVRNASELKHWADHADWIRSEIAGEIQSGADLIARAHELVPNLRFGRSAVPQISALTGTERYFQWLVKSLLLADSEVSGWDGGMFPHNRLPGPATGESGPVRNSPRLRDMRNFATDDGRTEFMEYHMKNLGENRRVHFLFEPSRRVMIIGYFGEHLETAQF